MAQILDSFNSDSDSGVSLCCYVNVASKVQIARITNIENWYFERVVFPGQRLMFNAPAEAQLEIHTGMMASSIMSDSIACSKLIVSEDESSVEAMFESQNDEGAAELEGVTQAA